MHHGLSVNTFFLIKICVKIAAKEIGELWMEYENNSSPEAKIVKDLDKVSYVSLESYENKLDA